MDQGWGRDGAESGELGDAPDRARRVVEWTQQGEINAELPAQTFVIPTIFERRREMWGPVLSRLDTLASHPECWDLLAQLASSPHVTTIVEAGTYKGHAVFAMAEALHRLGRTNTHIWTADIEDHGVPSILEHVGLSRYATFHLGRFDEMLERITAPIDLAFIDASEEGFPLLRLDYANRVLSRLAPNGVIVVDDSTNDAWEGAAMLRAQANLYLPLGHGLTFFQGPRT